MDNFIKTNINIINNSLNHVYNNNNNNNNNNKKYLYAEIYHYIINNYTSKWNHVPINPKKYKVRKDNNSANYYSIKNNDDNNKGAKFTGYGVYSPDLITNTSETNLNTNFFFYKYREIYTKPVKKSIKKVNCKNAYSNNNKTIFLERIVNATNANKNKYFNNIVPESLNHNNGFITCINVPEKAKVINFGDFHGSFHTFLRIFERFKLLGIIKYDDNKKLIIANDYYILFCGDILDRGTYAMEILDFMFELMINSPEQIIYIRGNHENESVYLSMQFKNEIYFKINRNQSSKFKDFFTYLPTAVIIHFENTELNYIACHGCIPIKDNWNDLNINNLFKKNNRNNQNNYTILDNFSAKQFRWNDLTTDVDFSKSNTRSPYASGNGDVYNISYNLLKEFLKEFNLNFLIRGHQDSDANTVLFGNKAYAEKGNYPTGTNILDIINNSNNNKIKKKVPSNLISKINTIKNYRPNTGPIARINFTNKQKINYKYDTTVNTNLKSKNLEYDNNIKAITLSTNTDFGRPLYIDSYTIIFIS
jgi:hypothetical protein